MPDQKPKCSILIAPEKDSKNLARTIISLFTKSDHIKSLEIIVGLYPDETENRDLQAFFMAIGALTSGVFQFQEIPADISDPDDRLNRLAEYAVGDFILPMRDGTFINQNHWDTDYINGIDGLSIRSDFTNWPVYFVTRDEYNRNFKVAPVEDLK
jgi:hypothetical protein